MELLKKIVAECSFICLQAVFQPVWKSTWKYTSFMLLTFISCFMIDFLSIENILYFSVIVTDDRH